ncbi:MAG TPA: hypothetical protein VES20_14945 [Bryobacteraceae bacterium]|nr:hypothetical protein [Bryobacteraceae bacterium]
MSDWGNGLFTLFEGSLGAPSPFANTPPEGGSWSNPFAAGLPQPNRESTFAGQNLRTFNRNHPLPIVSNWTFNIQHMIAANLLVQAGYVGNRITHVAQNRLYNQNDRRTLLLGKAFLTRYPIRSTGRSLREISVSRLCSAGSCCVPSLNTCRS